jgi:hypothetical protein
VTGRFLSGASLSGDLLFLWVRESVIASDCSVSSRIRPRGVPTDDHLVLAATADLGNAHSAVTKHPRRPATRKFICTNDIPIPIGGFG